MIYLICILLFWSCGGVWTINGTSNSFGMPAFFVWDKINFLYSCVTISAWAIITDPSNNTSKCKPSTTSFAPWLSLTKYIGVVETICKRRKCTTPWRHGPKMVDYVSSSPVEGYLPLSDTSNNNARRLQPQRLQYLKRTILPLFCSYQDANQIKPNQYHIQIPN